MRIIYITKNPYNEEAIRNNLREISEQDSVAVFYSYFAAEDFVNNHVIKDQMPLDLIITENNIQSQKATDFFNRITKDKKRTFSNRDFKFHTIPTILIVDKEENKSAFLQYGFSDVLMHVVTENLNKITPSFVNSVKRWRKSVLDEMDNIGIKFNSGIVDYKHFFAEERKRNIETDILSDNFKLLKRKLQYEWLKFNENQIEAAIDLYIKELKRASRLNGKKEEKRFHRLFNKYPFLVKRDNYDKHWYEERLYYGDNNWYEPDYALKPNFSQRTDLSILEVKLPNEGFIKRTKFHPKPYSSILDHIFQVNDYKEYLESDEYQQLILDAFGFVPGSVEYNILIGRLDDKTESFRIFNERMKQINATHINFITYDELLEYQVQYLERMKVLKIM